MFERAALRRVAPFAVYMGFVVLVDVLGRLGVEAATLRWLYPVKIAAVVGILFAWRGRYGELAWTRPDWRAVALSCATGVLVFVLWISLDAAWMSTGASIGFDPRTGGKIDWVLVMLRLAGAALVVPLMEELFWRSFLMRWLRAPDFRAVHPARVGAKAFFVTVILFGFEHNLWLAGIVAGAAYGLLYMHSRNLWSAILAHGVTNALLGGWIITTANWTYW